MYLSAQARSLLTSELDAVNEQLAAQDDALVEASGAGDNSQNGDIFAVFEEQSKLNTRAAEITRALSAHESASPAPEGVVAPAVKVEIFFSADDAEEMIFGSVEETPCHGLDVVSPASPIGQAIQGASEGDTVTVQGASTFEVQIGKVTSL